jgi:hypothetical protein
MGPSRTRRTVDLSPEQHKALDGWQGRAAGVLGRARVTGQEVLSTLVDRLLSDDELSAAVLDSLKAQND